MKISALATPGVALVQHGVRQGTRVPGTMRATTTTGARGDGSISFRYNRYVAVASIEPRGQRLRRQCLLCMEIAPNSHRWKIVGPVDRYPDRSMVSIDNSSPGVYVYLSHPQPWE